MNGVHDMGGMHGFGPLDLSEHGQASFHAEWEKRLRAIDRLVLEEGYFTLDVHRHAIERIPPADYLRSSYFERWLAALELILSEQGVVPATERDTRIELLREAPHTTPQREATAVPVPAPITSPPSPPSPAARFAVGDAVLTRNEHPQGHTRLPRYARGKRGVVTRLHGSQVFPDTNAEWLGENPQPLYSVGFEARDLWGETAEPRQTVTLELWDSYLEPIGLSERSEGSRR